MGFGSVGHSGLVVVSVTVVTEVVTEVTVVGEDASVVVGGAVVVGVTVVVTVVGAGCSLLLGDGAADWVEDPDGGGASLAADVVAVTLVEVPAGFVDDPALVNVTIA